MKGYWSQGKCRGKKNVQWEIWIPNALIQALCKEIDIEFYKGKGLHVAKVAIGGWFQGHSKLSNGTEN